MAINILPKKKCSKSDTIFIFWFNINILGWGWVNTNILEFNKKLKCLKSKTKHSIDIGIKQKQSMILQLNICIDPSPLVLDLTFFSSQNLKHNASSLQDSYEHPKEEYKNVKFVHTHFNKKHIICKQEILMTIKCHLSKSISSLENFVWCKLFFYREKKRNLQLL